MPRNKEQSERMRAESRSRILSTAQRLFAERGYEGCSVSDIAREAGMSQGNIYWYFPSKETILKTVLIEGFDELGAALARAAAHPGGASEKLSAFLSAYDTLIRDRSGEEFFTIVLMLIGQGGTGRFAELGLSTEQIGAGYHASLNAILEQGQREGSILASEEANLLAAFFFAFVNGLMLMYPAEWRQMPADSIRSAILRLLGQRER